MSGRLINGIKYMYVHNDIDFKKKSLNDNLYFTLRDVFWNTSSPDVCSLANCYNSMLSDNISFKERTNAFQYTNLLDQKNELKK